MDLKKHIMKKEIFIAILVGLTLGIIITYGVYRARQSFVQTPSNVIEPTNTPDPEATPPSNLVVTTPQDESIVDQKDITIAGTTDSTAFVVIIVQDEEYLTTADESGNFSIEAPLEAGSNVIQIHSINEDGESTVQEVTVIFSTVSFETEDSNDSETNSETQEASPSANSDEENEDNDTE